MKKYLKLMAFAMLAISSLALVSCSSDDDDNDKGGGKIPSALVGTWIQPSKYGTTGIKFTANGNAYYNEWNINDKPNFSNVTAPANVQVSGNIIRITHSQVPGYYEEYRYELSEDGKSVTFTLLAWKEDEHGLSGTFTKYE